MIKLLIEDSEVDVLQTERIVGEYAIAPIGNISKRVGARSITFKLPKTAKNRAVFESAEVPTSLSVKPYRRLKARLYDDGVDMNMLFFTLERVTEFYEGRVYGSNTDFFSKIDKLLSELDLRPYNHHWRENNITGSINNTEGYIYPVIDWHNDSPNVNMPLTGNQFGVSTLQACFFHKTIFKEIVEQAGFIWLDNIDYRNKEEIVALGCASFVRDTDGRKYIADFAMFPLQIEYRSFIQFPNQLMPTQYGDGLYFFCTNENEPYYENTTFAPVIPFQDDIRARFVGSFRFFSQTANTNYVIKLAYTTDTQTDLVELVLASGNNDGSFETINFDVEVEIKENPTFNNILASFYIITNGATFEFDALQSTFSISECTVIRARDITFSPADQNYVTIANNILGEKATQKEFVSDYLKLHNAFIATDLTNNVIYTFPFSDIKKNINKFVDWSGKLDFIDPKITTFNIGLAQNNSLTYQNDITVSKPNGTDGNIVIDDENLPVQKEYLSLKYAASQEVERLDNRILNQIRIYKEGLRDSDVVPRVLLLNRVSDTVVYGGTTVTGDIPYTYFISQSQAKNLGFGNSLINDYFNILFAILDRTKVIECLIRLNTSDIATFDFLRPVYIKELDGYFYVSKIKFEYTSNASSVCELVKLL
jgi:hypothetical protein